MNTDLIGRVRKDVRGNIITPDDPNYNAAPNVFAGGTCPPRLIAGAHLDEAAQPGGPVVRSRAAAIAA